MDVKPGRHGRRLTLKDVARAAGVAPSTVSNAYNRPDQLSAALRERILATARRMGYSGPDPRARSLRRGTSTTVGLVFPAPLSYVFTDPMAALLVQGVAEELERDGYALLLVGGSAEEPAPDPPPSEPVERASVDGFILHGCDEGDPLYRAALGRKLPTVLVDQLADGELPCVTIDDRSAAAGAMEHLLALGHRRFGVLAFGLTPGAGYGILAGADRARVEYRFARERLAGYAAAVASAGLSWERDVSVFGSAVNTVSDGARGMAALWALDPRPTAVLAMSDQLAFGALRFAGEQDIGVPEELSVVGFDDVPSAARSNPALTTVHQPAVRKGRESGRLLLAALKGEARPGCVWLPTRLVVRASTGPAPAPP